MQVNYNLERCVRTSILIRKYSEVHAHKLTLGRDHCEAHLTVEIADDIRSYRLL